MSKNFTKKTAPKLLLWAILSVLLVIVSGVVTLFSGLGISNHISADNYKTLTINVKMSSAEYETKRAGIEEVCEEVIAASGVAYQESFGAEVSKQLHELVYIFAYDADIDEIKNDLQAKFDADTTYQMNFIKVEAHQEIVVEKLPGGYLLRGIIAGVVIAVLAFLYVTLRYKLWNGIVAFFSIGLSAALTCAVVLLTRIPLTTTVLYPVEMGMILTAVLVLLMVEKLRKAETENEKPVADVDTLAETVCFKSGVVLCGLLLAAMAVIAIVGAFFAVNFVAFAAITAIAVLMSAFSAFVFAPSLYLPIRAAFEKVDAERARYDYKKGAKKEKKAKPAKKANAPVAEEAAPVEEAAAEEAAPVEEAAAEEAAPVEEAAAEEAAPVEETAAEEAVPVEEAAAEETAPVEEAAAEEAAPVEEAAAEEAVPVEEAAAEEESKEE